MCGDAEKHPLVRKRATNDSTESCFSSFTEMLNNYQMIDLFATLGTSNIKVNGYMSRPSTGKELKEGNEPGLMFCIPDNLREASILTTVKMAPGVRKKNKQALKKATKTKETKRKATAQQKY